MKTSTTTRRRKKKTVNPAALHYCTVAERDLVASITRESYAEFCKEFWPTVVQEQLTWNWHMQFLCDEVQTVCERIFRRQAKLYDLFVNIPPGSSKSTLTSILLTPWAWTRMQSFRLIGGSFDKELSLEFGLKSRRVVMSDEYLATFPEVKLSLDQNAKSHFANTGGGVRYCTSTGASVTGRHGHFILVDDPLNPRGVRSEAEVADANRWMRETLPSRCVDQSITVLACIMQRLGMDDPTGERLSRSPLWKPESA